MYLVSSGMHSYTTIYDDLIKEKAKFFSKQITKKDNFSKNIKIMLWTVFSESG